MSTGNIFHDLDIEGTLQCPVCYEIPPKTIFMCRVGHHMCERCRWRLTTCPICQSEITSCRNFLGEGLTNKFSILIKGSGAGGENGNLDNAINSIISVKNIFLSDNDQILKRLPNPSGIYKCLLESCRNRNGGMGVGHMYAHIEKVHTHIFEKFQNTSATFKHKFENFRYRDCVSKYHRAFQVVNMGLFFLNLETVAEKYINCWISTPASIKKCKPFHCELVFSKEDTTNTRVFVNKNLAFSNVPVFDMPSQPCPDWFNKLEALELWSVSNIELSPFLIKQLLMFCPIMRNILFNSCNVLTDSLFMEILQSNPLEMLSHLTIDHCHVLTMATINTLLDSKNELNVLRIWSCGAITRINSSEISQRITDENLDIYFEWFQFT